MLVDSEETWDRRLECISMPKHHTKPAALDVSPINSAPYSHGPKAHELEKTKFDKIIPMKVIKSAQSKSGSPIIFFPKRRAVSHDSLSTTER